MIKVSRATNQWVMLWHPLTFHLHLNLEGSMSQGDLAHSPELCLCSPSVPIYRALPRTSLCLLPWERSHALLWSPCVDSVMWLFPLRVDKSFLFLYFKSSILLSKLYILHFHFQYMAPDQSSVCYVEHVHASQANNDAPSKSALPTLAELVSYRDIGHSVTCPSALGHLHSLLSPLNKLPLNIGSEPILCAVHSLYFLPTGRGTAG